MTVPAVHAHRGSPDRATAVGENTLDAFVRLLRSKVDQGHKERLIHTMRGFGYCVRPEAKE